MASIGALKVSTMEATRGLELNVDVRAANVWRLKLACWLIHLATRIGGFAGVHFNWIDADGEAVPQAANWQRGDGIARTPIPATKVGPNSWQGELRAEGGN